MANYFVLLTGGHSGIGLELTKKLLVPGNKIGLIVRSEARKQDAIQALAEFPQDLVDAIDFFFADLSDQAQVRSAADAIKTGWPRVDRLFNNAGVAGGNLKTSKQGNEFHFEVNALAPYILTKALEPLLKASGDAKVVTTVTGGMHSRKLRADQLLDPAGRRTMTLYPQSKQAAMLLLNDLGAKWPNVKFLAVNPGGNKTDMSTGDEAPWIIRTIANLIFNEPEVGGSYLFDAAFDPRFANESAVYINEKRLKPIQHGMSESDRARLLGAIK